MQEGFKSPLTAQIFTKDNSPVCNRGHHKVTQKKGSLFPSLLSPSPSVHGTLWNCLCRCIWRTYGCSPLHNKQQECFGSLLLHPRYGTSLTTEKWPCHSLRSCFLRGIEPCPGTIMWAWQTLSLTGALGSPLKCVRISKTSSRRDIFAFLLPSQPCCKPRRRITEKLAHWCQKSLQHPQTLVKTDTKREYLI